MFEIPISIQLSNSENKNKSETNLTDLAPTSATTTPVVSNVEKQRRILEEINFLRQLKLCRNIVTLTNVFINKDMKGNKVVQMVMPLAKNGTLT